jgi:hypothetical protein
VWPWLAFGSFVACGPHILSLRGVGAAPWMMNELNEALPSRITYTQRVKEQSVLYPSPTD